MKLFTRTIAAFIFILLLSGCAGPVYETRHVVIVVLDGARYTETFGDSAHANIPMIWNQLRPRATIYTSFRNEGITMTNSGHSTILTGVRESLKNNGSELPPNPTLFEYYRKQTGAPATACWVALGKNKLQMLSHSNNVEFGERYGASVKTSPAEYDDRIAIDNVRSILSAHHPALSLVNLPETDEFAHNNNWAGYIRSIRTADTLITSLWNAIQSDSLLQGTTTLILVNDHGRHTQDFTDHGDHCEGCAHIMLMVIGPDTPPGIVDAHDFRQEDIAPTVAQLLGFKARYAIGNVITSAVAAEKQRSLR